MEYIYSDLALSEKRKYSMEMRDTLTGRKPVIKVKKPGKGTYDRVYDMVIAAIVTLEQAGQHDQAVLVLRHWREGVSISALMEYLDMYVYIELIPDQH